MRDHGSIGLFLGNGFFSCGECALSVLGLFLFCFCLVWGEQATDAQGFGWQSKVEDHFRSWFPFFFLFNLWQFCIVQILSGSKTFLHISYVFFRSLIENFLSFFAFSHSLIGNFISFLLSPTLWLGILFLFFCFLPRARIDILTLDQGLW